MNVLSSDYGQMHSDHEPDDYFETMLNTQIFIIIALILEPHCLHTLHIDKKFHMAALN